MRKSHTGQPLVREHGCVMCQRDRKDRYFHREGIDAEYEPHIYWQSKHGYYERIATPNEVLQLIANEKEPAHA